MKEICNPLDEGWFVDSNKTTSKIITIDASNSLFTIEGPREIIVENNTCECGQTLDQSWRYCPKCGGKLAWN